MAEMMPPWLFTALGEKLYPPLRNAPGHRSADTTRRVLEQFRVTDGPRYLPRDLTGDGRVETLCNYLASDATGALGCKVPQMLANQQIAWLDKHLEGWRGVPRVFVPYLLQLGLVVVAGRRRFMGHGHIAMCKPPAGGVYSPEIRITQAGRVCGDGITLLAGFGAPENDIRFWFHD